jgi:Leucine-rich repeat (LRR) protein
MKKTVLLLTAVLFTVFLVSCGGSKDSDTSSDTEVVEDEGIQTEPLKTAEELVDIEKMDEEAIAALDNKDEVIRYSSSYNISKIPEEVFEAKNLQTMELNNYNGESLPEELENLQNLTVLYISGGTNLKTLPDNLPNLKNLKTVSISAANSLDLAAAIKILSKCEKLENLQINYCEVESEIPAEIGAMKNLKVLDLSSNMISSFPAEFYTLPNLVTLKLTSTEDYRYDYEEIFAKLKELPKLESLSVYYSGLTGLPEIFNDYPALKTINWRENGAGWGNTNQIEATTEKWNAMFPNITVSWSTASSPFYDLY